MALTTTVTRSRSLLPAFARSFSAATNLVGVEVNDKTGVALVNLQKPPVNSLNLELLTEIKQCLQDLEKNKSRGAIITSPFKTFCAGLDIMEMYKPNLDRAKNFWSTLQDVWIALFGSSYPTVALINGPSPAGGCLLALSCEYRVMVPKSIIGLNETQLGIVAPPWFVATMTHTIGSRQSEMALTQGKLFTSEEALRIGLVDEIVQSKEEGLASADKFLKGFARIPPYARSLSKQMVRGEILQRMIKNREADLKLFMDTVAQDKVQKSLGMYIEALKKQAT